MSVKFFVNGTHTTRNMYRAMEDLTFDRQVCWVACANCNLARHRQQLITPSARREVALRMAAGILFLYEHEDIS